MYHFVPTSLRIPASYPPQNRFQYTQSSEMLRIKDGFKGERALTLPLASLMFMEQNAMTSPLYITHIGHYPMAKHHFRRREEPIDQWIFIYCTDGQGYYEVEGVEYKVPANHYFIIPANTRHSYGSNANNPWTIYWIHFKGSIVSQIMRDMTAPRPLLPSQDSRISDRIALFEQMIHTLERGFTPQNLQFSSAIMYHFFGSLLFVNEFRSASGKMSDSIVELALHYVKENLEHKISVEQLSEALGYSASHLSAIFRRETSLSPVEFINSIRIRESCRLLDFTDMRINQICHKVGIADSYYFTRLFTNVMGISPTEYRKQKKG